MNKNFIMDWAVNTYANSFVPSEILELIGKKSPGFLKYNIAIFIFILAIFYYKIKDGLHGI